MRKKILFSSKGFTLTELLIIIFIFLLIIGAVYSSHLLSYRSYQAGEKMAEVAQNGRVILERASREIRQAREIATELPAQEINATDTIEFEDGHLSESYHYIRYFKEEDDVKREVRGYYFSGDAGTLVPWDAEPPVGQTLEIEVLESPKIIGEYVSALGFWGNKLIGIDLTLEKGDKKFNLETKVFGRNL